MRKQIYFSNALDKELLAFIDKQSSLSRTLALGMQVLYEVFGNVDIKDHLPPGFEANDELVTYEKLLKKAGKTAIGINTSTVSNSDKSNDDLLKSIDQKKLIELLKLTEALNPSPLQSELATVESQAVAVVAPVETPVIEQSKEKLNKDENVEENWAGVNPDMDF